jgi:SAM-dependent methyltransferase
MDSAAASKLYDCSYYHGGDYADYEASEHYLKMNFDAFAARMCVLRSRGRLLEVGCAYGYFLDIARQHWDAEGIDISADAIASSRARLGDRVFCGDLLSHRQQPGVYDWVVAWDTIEHVDKPRAYIQRFFDLLAPGGRTALTTGDVSSPVARMRGRHWRLLTPPSHLTFFSRQGIRYVLSDAGFEDIRIGTVGYRRPLDFVLHRILGAEPYRRAIARHPRLRARLQAMGFYLNLFDVMFVTARKPESSRST